MTCCSPPKNVIERVKRKNMKEVLKSLKNGRLTAGF